MGPISNSHSLPRTLSLSYTYIVHNNVNILPIKKYIYKLSGLVGVTTLVILCILYSTDLIFNRVIVHNTLINYTFLISKVELFSP